MKPFLLLQARKPDDPMRSHEHGCFAAAMGLQGADLRAVDIVERTPTAADLEGVAGVLIGGSGNYGARGEEAWLHGATQFLREQVIEPGVPLFGVCFGLQLLGRTLGVDVIHDPERREVGSYEIVLSEEAKSCSLFGTLPERFYAQQGHNDRITHLPEGTTLLAANNNAPVQALRVNGKPVWATQFHPELTRKDNRTRYMRYISAYGGTTTPPEQDPVLRSMRETPHPTTLLRRFGEMVLAGEA